MSNFINTLVRHIATRSRYNAIANELGQLTNRELADIGISRWDIPRIAREHAERQHA